MQKDDEKLTRNVGSAQALEAQAPEQTVASKQLHIVSIKLSPEQQDELHKLTGERITVLKVGVEDLIDLGDLVCN